MLHVISILSQHHHYSVIPDNPLQNLSITDGRDLANENLQMANVFPVACKYYETAGHDMNTVLCACLDLKYWYIVFAHVLS